jgi:ComF family protein
MADLARLSEHRCPVCAMPTPRGEVCGVCLKQPPHFDRITAAYPYEFPLSVLIQQLKYGGELALAPWLAERIAVLTETDERPEVLIPMPLHPVRLAERGFNQAALIASYLGTRLNIKVELDACSRVKNTMPQVELPLKARRRNVHGAFACNHDLTGRHVALVDDVATSGASLNALAKTVKGLGASRVSAWVVARTVKD